jgi:signal transduction histidine kinase
VPAGEPPSPVPRLGGWLLRSAFAAIVATFLLANGVAMHEAQVVQQKNQLLVDDMLTSIQLVSRLGRDVDQRRLLVDEHIFEARTEDMARIERRLDRVEADFADAARAYDPIADLEGERAAWEDLRAQAAALDEPVARALVLSRRNQDVEARQVMSGAARGFEAISRDTTALIQLNRAGADRTVGEIASLQRWLQGFFRILTAAGAGLALLVAVLVTRLIRRREQEIRRATAALEERNRDLDAFAGRVAHDLRGPLTTISLAASRLAERAPQELGTSAVLRRGVARMEALIRDLLTLSRLDAQVHGMVCDPAEVAATVAEELAPRLQSEGGSLRVDVEPAAVSCSDGLLHQVLWNLADNGMKYGRPGTATEIRIRGRQAGGGYQLLVSDNGIGMSPDESRQAFEPFYRALRAQDTPGTGLGLSIVKRVVQLSGGTVSVDSEVGRGSTFVIGLRVVRRPGSSPRAGGHHGNHDTAVAV